MMNLFDAVRGKLASNRNNPGVDNTEKAPFMNTEERDRFIKAKLDQGMSLSEVQKVLAAEHGVTMTYLDLRLLAAEMKVDWKKQDKARPPEKKTAVATDLKEEHGRASGTKVNVSRLVRPGAAMSGDVEFASGAKAEWFVDAMGRLGLQPAPGSSKPTERDIQEFQTELQRKLGGGD